MIEQNAKERFEKIKNLFNSTKREFGNDNTVLVTRNFIEDFGYLIKLVENLDAYNKLNKELMEIEVFMKDDVYIIREKIKESKIDCDGNLIFFGELTQKQFYIKKEYFVYYTLREIKQ